jgi:prolipoprotein diacylglyceryltransferase
MKKIFLSFLSSDSAQSSLRLGFLLVVVVCCGVIVWQVWKGVSVDWYGIAAVLGVVFTGKVVQKYAPADNYPTSTFTEEIEP